jgi:excinuclease ABC subunit C
MKNDLTINNIFDLGAGRYPHLKMTGEPLPRVLATRRIEDDDAEYYGAFLTRTAVRIMIDFVNRVFRLRGCDIELDGSWPMPCTQFYRGRCLAPCTARLCTADEYRQVAELARLFIADQRGVFLRAINRIIDLHAEALDFEKAARYRDILVAVEKYWKQPRWHVWLDDSVDSYAVEDTAEGTNVFLVTHRGRNVLGRKAFTIDRYDAESSDIALAEIIGSFYVSHLPREIRVSRDFHCRRELARQLSDRFGREVRIVVAIKGSNAIRGLHLNRDEHELDMAKPVATPEAISSKLKGILGLAKGPRRIECFDVAHISGTGFVGASSVWVDGGFKSEEYLIVIPDSSAKKTELSTLADTVMTRLSHPTLPVPDLIVLDGGISQIGAVRRTIEEAGAVPAPLVGAVKPTSKHSAVSYFLIEGGDRIAYDAASPAHAMLQILRDEAHNLANRIHRDYREMKPFYEAAGFDEPVIVPIRLHAENGGAEDLIPIETR